MIDFEVMVLSDDSVRVSWESPNGTDYTVNGYAVFYSPVGRENGSVNIIKNANSATIVNLTRYMEYRFQVAVLAEIDGHVIMGETSTRILFLGPGDQAVTTSVGNQVSFGDQAVTTSVGDHGYYQCW